MDAHLLARQVGFAGHSDDLAVLADGVICLDRSNLFNSEVIGQVDVVREGFPGALGLSWLLAKTLIVAREEVF